MQQLSPHLDTNRQTDKQTNRQTDREKHRGKETDRPTDTETDTQTHRQTEGKRQTVKTQRLRQRDKDRHQVNDGDTVTTHINSDSSMHDGNMYEFIYGSRVSPINQIVVSRGGQLVWGSGGEF